MKIEKSRIVELHEEFKETWRKHGKPDPSSNDYLNLTRAFYYVSGIEDCWAVAQELEEL